MENKRIRITKLKESENPLHPRNIEEGFSKEGILYNEPSLGDRFHIGGGWSTSAVQKIIDKDTFETYNSIYKIERLYEEIGIIEIKEPIVWGQMKRLTDIAYIIINRDGKRIITTEMEYMRLSNEDKKETLQTLQEFINNELKNIE